MVYMGSKSRIAKFLIPIMSKHLDREFYIEPFVGGANMIDKVPHPNKIGYDKNKYLISLLNYCKENIESLPTSISESEYLAVKDSKHNYPDWYVGLVGFCVSYGGRFFEGFARGDNKDGSPRNYYNERINNLKSQCKTFNNIKFYISDYNEVSCDGINCILYCDPPYQTGKKYKSFLGNFDSEKFWDWVELRSQYNPVYISEQQAPQNFVEVWGGEIKNNLNKTNTTKENRAEKLFLHKNWI